MIQNGKLIIAPARDIAFEKYQFPIRKSNYNPQKVERMLLSKDQFRQSVARVQNMKDRISKYNQDFVPMAQ